MIAGEAPTPRVARFNHGKRQKAEAGGAVGYGVLTYGYHNINWEVHGKQYTLLAPKDVIGTELHDPALRGRRLASYD